MTTGAPLNALDFGAVGDDATDDTVALQAALDEAHDSKKSLYIPSGTYKITAPLIVWSTDSNDGDAPAIIYGETAQGTIIKKYGNVTATNGVEYHASYNPTPDKDAVIIIKSNWMKANGDVLWPNFWTNQTRCYYVEMSDIQLRFDGIFTDPNRVDYGIVSAGLFKSKFTDMRFNGFLYGMSTLIWNAYCIYKQIHLERCHYGFDFMSGIGGNTTMTFKNGSMNGPDGFGFHLKGGGVIEKWPIDGGTAQHFYLTTGRFTIINGYNESFANAGCIHTIGGDVHAIDTNFIPGTNASYVFKAEQYGKIFLNNCGVGTNNALYSSPAQTVITDAGSRVVFDKCYHKVDQDAIATPTRIATSEDEYRIMFDRFDFGAYNAFTAYVPAGRAVVDYPVMTVARNTTTKRLDLVTTGIAGDRAGIAFTTGIDVTNMSKLSMLVTLSDTNNASTAIFTMGVTQTLPAAASASVGIDGPPGFQYNGVASPGNHPWLWGQYWYNQEDATLNMDVTALTGIWYPVIKCSTTTAGFKANIKDFYFIR